MDYLFALQTLRENAPAFINAFFTGASELVLVAGALIALNVHWCVDKRAGQWLLFAFGWATAAANVVKIIACVPRPWILDPRLHLPAGMEGTATGYSFPSGHTANAAATYGGAAWLLWKNRGESPRRRKLRIAGAAALLFLVALTAFARNWLGAHSSADVLAAIGITAVIMVVLWFVMKLVDAHPTWDVAVAAGMLALVAGCCLYAHFATFPQVHDYAGNALELDNYALATDTWAALGMVSGIIIGWIVERRFIGFSVEGTLRQRVIRGVAGSLVFGLFFLGLSELMILPIASPHLAAFLQRFISMIAGCALVPALIKWAQVRSARSEG